MRTFSTVSSVAVGALLIVNVGAAGLAPSTPSHAIVGAWTLNSDLSDQPVRGDQGDSDRGRRGDGGRGFGGGGRRGGGGFGGGRAGGRGGGMGRGASVNPEDMARMREAIRDLTDPSNHLTIVETESMIVITSADGRTTRLSPDGKKIKDDNTGIERKTKWEGDKLTIEIGGLGPAGKATQTFSADAESHQLRVVVHMEGGRAPGSGGNGRGPRTITHVYDNDKYTK